MADQMDVEALLKQARENLTSGKDKQAAQLLTDAAYHYNNDPRLEQQLRELAAQGLERAGRFGKARWNEIIRIADLHIRHPA
jgi:phage shock protein A